MNQEKEKLYSEEFMDTVYDDMDSNEKSNVNSYTNDNDNNNNEDNENENENEKIVNEKNTVINTDIEKNNNFNEVKENVEKLENNTKVVLEDFNEMYAKLFGTTPIGAEIEKNIQEENKANSNIENDNKKVLPDILQELTPMNVKKDNI